MSVILDLTCNLDFSDLIKVMHLIPFRKCDTNCDIVNGFILLLKLHGYIIFLCCNILFVVLPEEGKWFQSTTNLWSDFLYRLGQLEWKERKGLTIAETHILSLKLLQNVDHKHHKIMKLTDSNWYLHHPVLLRLKWDRVATSQHPNNILEVQLFTCMHVKGDSLFQTMMGQHWWFTKWQMHKVKL